MYKTNFIKEYILRIALLGLIWWIITEGALNSWIMGIPAVIFGSLLVSRIPAVYPFKLRASGVFSFLIYFIGQSLLSALDVALRAVHPKLPLSPSFIRYDYRLSNELAVVVFTNTISLLPGTLSVDLCDKYIVVHVLNELHPILKALRKLEEKVAKVFGEGI